MLGRDTNTTDVLALRNRLDRVDTLLMNTLPRVASLETWKSDRAIDHTRITAVEGYFQKPQDLRNELWGHRRRIHEIEKHLGIRHPALETIQVATSVAAAFAEDQPMYEDADDGHEPRLPSPAPANMGPPPQPGESQ